MTDDLVPVPRMYNKDEYWDLSGLPFEIEKNPQSADLDPDVDDPALD